MCLPHKRTSGVKEKNIQASTAIGDCYALQEDCDGMECQLDESLDVALQEVIARDDKIDLLESEIVRLRASIRNDVSAPATEGVVSSVTPAQEPRSKRQRQNEVSAFE